MTTHRPSRPPTFTWESDRDWSGRLFTVEDPAATEQACEHGVDVAAAEVTLPVVEPDSGSVPAPAAMPAPAPGPQPDRPAGPSGAAAPAEPTTDRGADSARSATDNLAAAGAVAADPADEAVVGPPPGVLAEDVFAGLLDDPPQPPAAPPEPPSTASAAPDGDRPAEVVEPVDSPPSVDGPRDVAVPRSARTAVVGAELALTDPAGGAVAECGRGAAVARLVWSRVLHAAPGLGREDATAAVAAGELAYLRALVDPRAGVRDRAGDRAGQAAERAATRMVAVLGRGDGERGQARGRVSWKRAGLVIPVLGAGSGVGASVAAAAVFDALDAAGIPTLLVDAAEPARSGLIRATGHLGNAADRRPHREVGIAFAPRGGGWVAALSAPPDELLTDAVVPSPTWWLPVRATPAVTVVDLGWDPWAIAAGPLRGSGVWLEAGDPPPQPLLVTTATRPGVGKARELLDRLRPWAERGVIAAPAGLVVVGARRWPREVRPVALRHLGALADQAVLLPHDRTVAVAGVGPDPLPGRLRAPFAPLLRRWGLPVTAAPAIGRFWRGH